LRSTSAQAAPFTLSGSDKPSSSSTRRRRPTQKA
jgi:hypothetical protein